ncbi:MAG TPA: zinc ABC transporter substrate-binding protein [Symbiobacteriaceae bacterium]|nr:zinc ABC transporter substrate-binding protein [Symbiobacteriaceae bacterium]
MNKRGWGVWLALTLAAVLLVTGCGPASGGGAGGKLKVTVTTGMIADLVGNVGKDHVEVTALMGSGVDPHLYKASEGDIAKLADAQIIFYNGLHLEGRMGDIFVKMAAQKPTIAVAEGIPKDLLLETAAGTEDPHIWFDVANWIKALDVVRDGLVAKDPAHKADYEANAAAYLTQLQELDSYARTQLASIPKEQRVMVTAHDAFNYFGRAYDVEVMGLQGISTAAEYGLNDVQRLVDLLVQRKIKAVFVESSVPKRSIEALVEGARAKGHTVEIGGELFSDAMGAPGTPEGTYLGMVRHNVDTIVKALK